MALVDIHNLTKKYIQDDLETPALRGVELEIGEGEFSALVGPSGSGKTTLLNIIGGLDNPTSGTVTVNGNDVGKMRPGDLSAFRLHNIGFVFQAYNLVPVLSAQENVEFVMVLQGRPAGECRTRA